MQPDTQIKKTFHLILIKPVRYDEDGYPIQWRRAVYPSLALSVLNGLAEDCAERKVLGPDTGITFEAWDDQCGLPKMEEMVQRARSRTPEAVATYIRDCVKEGRNRFLFTDDNFARNLKWKEILLAMIALKEDEGLDFTFVLQADTRSHRIPDFIDLAARAGSEDHADLVRRGVPLDPDLNRYTTFHATRPEGMPRL